MIHLRHEKFRATGGSVFGSAGFDVPNAVVEGLNRMAPAQTLGVLATDPGSERDFQVFAQQSGHELLDWSVDGTVYAYTIRKKS